LIAVVYRSNLPCSASEQVGGGMLQKARDERKFHLTPSPESID
jgi:hypothetical protein